MLELNALYNMDCMAGMAHFPDKYFDLAIVDPPYGINAPNMQMGSTPKGNREGYPAVSTAQRLKGRLNQGSGKLKNRILNNSSFSWDNEVPPSEYFSELSRVSKNQIIWGGNYFNLPPARCFICWDKIQPWDNFSQFELAWTSFDKPAAMFRLSNTGGANKEKKIHPTQKPEKLYKWLLSKFAVPGYKILDTHAGSCSSLIACIDMGFEFMGFEIDTHYYIESCERIAKFQSKLKLF